MITVDSSVIKLTVEGGSLSDWNGANEIVAATEHNGKWLLVNSKGLIFSVDLEELSPSPKKIIVEPVAIEVKPEESNHREEPKEEPKVPKLPKQRKRYATTKPRSDSSQE
jgi:hypothetical protein